MATARPRDAEHDASVIRRSKRHRRPAAAVAHATPSSAAEARMLRAALNASTQDQAKAFEPVRVEPCPVFTPTVEEFRDPIRYMRSIARVGYKHGIVKIVPPQGWKPPCGVTKTMASRPLATREQHVHKLLEATEFDDGKEYTLPEYKAMADRFIQTRFPQLWPTDEGDSSAASDSTASSSSSSSSALPSTALAPAPGQTRDLGPPSACLRKADAVEQEYWRIVETGDQEVTVEYGNDQDVRVNGSGFPSPLACDRGVGVPSEVEVDFDDPSFYRRTGWNFLNLPRAEGSLLRYMKDDVAGVNVPWLYVGMLFASFAWHTEDNYLYSANYMHYGTAKTWYGIPSNKAAHFDAQVKRYRAAQLKEEPDAIHGLTTVMSPNTLRTAGVPVYHTVQEPGQFVITFPRGYHSGFSHGFNIAEACNFALPDWIPMGRMALRHYEKVARDTCFSHEEVIINAAQQVHELDLETCELVAKEMHEIALAEADERRTFLAIPGVSAQQVMRLSGSEQRYNCAVTSRMCYVSAAICDSPKCCQEAEDRRREAHKVYLDEVKRLVRIGVDPSSLIEPDPQHSVVKPRFADDLCDCDPKFLRMVTWFSVDELRALAKNCRKRLRQLKRHQQSLSSSSSSSAAAAAAAAAAGTTSSSSSSSSSSSLSVKLTSGQRTPQRLDSGSGPASVSSPGGVSAISSAPAAAAASD